MSGARLQLCVAALLFSTAGAAIKGCGFGAWQVACLRCAVAVATLLVLLPEARRRWSVRTSLVGAVYGVNLLLFAVSNKLTTAANVIFLQSTAPLYILLIGPRLLREPVRRGDLAFMLALTAGLGLCFAGAEPALATAPHPTAGNLLAAVCGLTWALTVTGIRLVARDGSGDVAGAALVAGNLFAALASLPLALPLSRGSAGDWLLVGYLGVFQIGVAYILLSRAARRVGALEASLLLLLEPVLSPLWAWMAQGERPGPWSLAGGTVILLATAVHAAGARR